MCFMTLSGICRFLPLAIKVIWLLTYSPAYKTGEHV